MHSYRKAHEQGYEDYPPVRIFRVSLFFPFEHGPEHDCREKGRHRIDLSLDCGKPKRVRKTIYHRADYPGTYDGGKPRSGPCLRGFPVRRRAVFFLVQPAAEMHDGQIKEHYGKRRAQRAHRVYKHCGGLLVAEERERPRYELENRVSWRMTYFQFI